MSKEFDDLKSIITALRHPIDGCPWDKVQTHESLKPYVLEETYEVLEAIDQGDDQELEIELGDLLLQIALHSPIASEREAFDLNSIARTLREKLIRRHPHVFGPNKEKDPEGATRHWETQKKLEREANSNRLTSPFDGIPKHLPALLRAHRMGEKAASFGFDWKRDLDTLDKVEEELGELAQELTRANKNKDKITEEIGDLLFAVSQLSRKFKIAPEDALRRCCQKFERRFNLMQEILANTCADPDLKQLEQAWEQAKTRLQTPPEHSLQPAVIKE